MKTILTIIALLTVTTVAQAELNVDVSLGSKHLSSTVNPQGKAYNEKNPGVSFGYRAKLDTGFDIGAKLGTYKNSYFRQSNYLAADVGYQLSDTVRFGLLAGVISGYDGNNVKGGYGPMLAPQLELSYGGWTQTTTFVPTTIKGGSSALAVSIGYKF